VPFPCAVTSNHSQADSQWTAQRTARSRVVPILFNHMYIGVCKYDRIIIDCCLFDCGGGVGGVGGGACRLN
jgi:hypothetical protein